MPKLSAEQFSRVIWPRFMVWSRMGKHALRVELAKMRCARVGHKHLIGKWSECEQRHIAYCIECETMLPEIVVRDEYYRELPIKTEAYTLD